MLFLILFAALAAAVITGNHEYHEYWVQFVRMLGAPLAFFRLTRAPSASGPMDAFIVLLIRVVGLFLIVLSVFAARKVVRAE